MLLSCLLLLLAGARASAQVSDISASSFTNFLPLTFSSGGHPTNYTYRIINFGPNSAGAITTEFILSRDTTLGNGDDISIGTRQDSTSTFFPGTSTITISAPSGIPTLTMPAVSGSFYVWIRVSHSAGTGRTDPNLGNNVALLLNPTNSAPVLIAVGDAPPTVTSIIRFSPTTQTNNAQFITWLVNFSEPVLNVQVNDFQLVPVTGGLPGAFLTTVSAAGGSQIQVSANTGSGGTADIRLDVIAGSATISDLAGNALVTSFTNGQAYTIDKTRPTVVDVVDVSPDPRTNAVESVDIVMSEPVPGISYTALSLTRNGSAVALNNTVTLASVSSNRVFRASGLETFTSVPGAYVLTANASGIFDYAFNSGTGSVSDAWATVFPLDAIIYVDAAYAGPIPSGTLVDPFRNVGDANQSAQNGNTIRIFSNNYPESLHVTTAVRIEATNGVVNIGRP